MRECVGGRVVGEPRECIESGMWVSMSNFAKRVRALVKDWQMLQGS